jgi:hypothetical protein
MNLTVSEKAIMIEKLKSLFKTDEVSYNGSNRFVVREQYSVDAPDGIYLFKDRLFDQNCKQIELSRDYNSIFYFVGDVAAVCIWEGDAFSKCRKDGLIDRNGKELLPCIYDKVRVNHPEGTVEVTKNNLVKVLLVNQIISGDWDWDDADTR